MNKLILPKIIVDFKTRLIKYITSNNYKLNKKKLFTTGENLTSKQDK